MNGYHRNAERVSSGISNLDTGDIDTYYVTLDDNGQEFQINDSGEFEISIICGSGVYEGLFII